MTSLENYQLVHPELLTEDSLLQVLRDRCVDLSRLKSTSKTELVEIFKRVALPLPQRRYSEDTYLGRKLIGLRKSRGQQQEPALPPGIIAPDSSHGSGRDRDERIVHRDRLKPPLAGGGMTETKIIRLQSCKSPTIANAPCELDKRKIDDTLSESRSCKKRQKITWP